MSDAPVERSEKLPRDEAGRFVLKLTDEVQTRITDLIRAGVPIEFAAAEAGVVKVTFYNWMKAGRAAIANANGNLATVLAEDPFARFAYEVEQPQAKFVSTNLLLIGSHGREEREGQWQALAWMLERRFPTQFGRRARVEHTGEGGGPIQHAIALDPDALERLSPERLALLREIVAEMQGEVIDGEAEPVEIEA